MTKLIPFRFVHLLLQLFISVVGVDTAHYKVRSRERDQSRNTVPRREAALPGSQWIPTPMPAQLKSSSLSRIHGRSISSVAINPQLVPWTGIVTDVIVSLMILGWIVQLTRVPVLHLVLLLSKNKPIALISLLPYKAVVVL